MIKRLLTKIGAARCAGLFLLAVLLAGCRREEITVYRVPKEKEPARVDTQPQIEWQTPPGWEEQAPSKMSLANFSVPGDAGRQAQLSVMTFPGEGASELSLVNIVRENAGLPPVSDEELAKLVETVNVGPASAKLVDLTGAMKASSNAAPNRILVAVFARGGTTWFFKLAGDAGVVTAQKQAFIGFLNSVTFVEPRGTRVRAAHFASTNAKRVPIAPDGDAGVSDNPLDKPSWDAPAGWREVPRTQMLLAKFLISSSDGKAEVTVSTFPGDAGGVLANVNRWRVQQLGLNAASESDLSQLMSSLDVPGGKAMLVDMSGRNQKTGEKSRLISVIVPREGQTWFYKLMGDPAVAGREKTAFIKFVQSVRYPNV